MLEKNKKINKRNKSMTLIFLLLLVVSIGFSYLTSNLSIFGSSLLKGQKWDVHFENVQLSDEGVQIEKPEIIDKTSVEYNITLDKPGDFVEFTVDAKNDGSVDAMIKTITPLTLYDGNTELVEIPSYLEYRVYYADYEDVPIAENHLLKAGQSTTYKVHVEYKKDITEDQLVTIQKKLKAEFDVTYEAADNTAISLRNGADLADEDTLRIKIQNILNQNGVNEYQVKLLDRSYKINLYDMTEDNIISSVDSEYPVYLWYDASNSTMNYYCEADKIYLHSYDYMNDEGYNSNIFRLLPGVEKINLDGFDITYVKFMDNYFEGLFYLKELDISDFDTSNVESMQGMFSNCLNLTKITFGDINTENVKDMSRMFMGDTSLKEIDLTSFNTDKVRNMESMFAHCESLTSLDLSTFNTENVEEMEYMFYSCRNLEGIIGIDFNTSRVYDMHGMFYNAGDYAITFEIDLTSFDVSKVENMSEMFLNAGANSKTFEIKGLSGWDTSNVTNMNSMFQEAGKEATTWSVGDISGWDTGNVTEMCFMFSSAGENTTEWSIGDISRWDTSKVINMERMFSWTGHNANYSLDLSGWNVNKVVYFDAFNECVESKVTPPNWVN